jgi:hypothetical protein
LRRASSRRPGKPRSRPNAGIERPNWTLRRSQVGRRTHCRSPLGSWTNRSGRHRSTTSCAWL